MRGEWYPACKNCGQKDRPEQMFGCDDCDNMFCDNCFRDDRCAACHDKAIRRAVLDEAIDASADFKNSLDGGDPMDNLVEHGIDKALAILRQMRDEAHQDKDVKPSESDNKMDDTNEKETPVQAAVEVELIEITDPYLIALHDDMQMAHVAHVMEHAKFWASVYAMYPDLRAKILRTDGRTLKVIGDK